MHKCLNHVVFPRRRHVRRYPAFVQCFILLLHMRCETGRAEDRIGRSPPILLLIPSTPPNDRWIPTSCSLHTSRCNCKLHWLVRLCSLSRLLYHSLLLVDHNESFATSHRTIPYRRCQCLTIVRCLRETTPRWYGSMVQPGNDAIFFYIGYF